jgi:hypothetical protein
MKPTEDVYRFPENGMKTPETKLTVETCNGAFSPAPSLSFSHANREVLRITNDGHIICGEGLSTEEATQEAAKLLIQAFEEQIQKMVDARVANLSAEVERLKGCCDELDYILDNEGYPSGKDYAAMQSRAEMAEASAKSWEADALRYANNTEFWKARAEKAEAEVSQLTDALDMMKDEFMRIIASPNCTSEIKDFASRAQLKLVQRVPVITQRDRAEAELAAEREKVRVLRDALKVLVENGGIGPESMFHNAREALVITWEASK